MEPEIARRCPSCGASVRGAAHFCPQCGGPMAAGAQNGTAQTPALVEEAERVASALEGRLAGRGREDERRRAEIGARADEGAATDARAERGPLDRVGLATARPAIDQNTTAPGSSSDSSSSSDPGASSAIRRADAPRSSDAARTSESDARESRGVKATGEGPPGGALGRAAAVGAGVSESLRPRVERLRERSVVVLDEAADDPGLRFVLVAAALFVVALLLYVFSFVLR